MKILAIETSCDETGISLLEAKNGLKNPEFKLLRSVISSQIKIHRPFGGVVPNLAKREHICNLPVVYKKILKGEKNEEDFWKKIDLIAVTVGPGLEPALWTGINFAENLSKKFKKPILGVNHLEGHLYSFLLAKKSANSKFPAIALLVSGGHTMIIELENLTHYQKLGETLDDAAGEAFDKVARMLRLPYPGGPEIEKISLKGNKNAINFPRPMMHDKSYNFSFSGLKTSVLYYIRDNAPKNIGSKLKADVAASFQEASIDVLTSKTIKAAKEYNAKSVLLSGGVASNKALRKSLKEKSKKIGADFLVPDFKFNTDNASMIGAAAYIKFLNKKKKLKIAAQGNLSL
jgi:N6-L-threonylcarbamoyladenine synthase